MDVAGIQIGIDENGLGPRLGPMVVTAARVEIDPARVRDRRRFVAACVAAGIGDSKAACSHGAMSAVEGRVLALLEVHLGARPTSLTELTAALHLESHASQSTDCPTGEAPVACFGAPIALPAFGPGPDDSDLAAARRLAAAGVAIRGVRFGTSCARRMNRGRDAGISRFDLDLELMVRLIAALRGDPGSTLITAYCGKVGGRMRYAAALEALAPLVAVLGETRARSSYGVPRVGEVHFVMDGDASEPAIGLASLVGKYVRELWMDRLNRYWIGAAPAAIAASGYHDPVTARFIAATALARSARAVPDDCFER